MREAISLEIAKAEREAAKKMQKRCAEVVANAVYQSAWHWSLGSCLDKVRAKIRALKVEP